MTAIDDSGDRKDGTRTAHLGRQWPGRYGKTDNGVTATTVWADEHLYYPLHAQPPHRSIPLRQETGRSRLPDRAATQTLPDKATWYLATNLPRPAARTPPDPAHDPSRSD